MSTKTAVYYKDFGAKADGVTDDFAAIKAAHAYANEKKLPVIAESGKSYYIGKSGAESICIKTSTDWTGAKIIIDDSNIAPDDTERRTSVFKICSDSEPVIYDLDSELVKLINISGGLKTDTKKVPFSFGYESMIIPYNKNHRVYIRYGLNKNNGQDQHEVIIIDKDGNVDKETPFLLDYDEVTSLVAYRIDDTPITIEGGTVVTVANLAPSAYTYYSRNILISRSNVTLKNLEHKIVGEADHGAPYAGFLTPKFANNILVEGCTFQAHRYYLNLDPKTGGPTNMGTYELGGNDSNKLYYKNCKQSNFMTFDGKKTNVSNIWYDIETGDTGIKNDGSGSMSCLWGVMGTNYCKNITYDSCLLNRFDAHAGVYNASLIGTETMMINIIGGGTALIKDSKVYSNVLATLRGDYGSTWHGEVVVDNVTLVTENEYPKLLHAVWANHDFGYETYIPNVSISNFTLESENADTVYIFSEFTTEDFHADKVYKDCEKYLSEDQLKDGPQLVDNRNKQHLPDYVKISKSPNVRFEVASSSESALNGKIKITYQD